ncbi:MAG: DUF6259 domain-containing protein [Gemmatimonadota bacterium]
MAQHHAHPAPAAAPATPYITLANEQVAVVLRQRTGGGLRSLIDASSRLDFVSPRPQPLYRLTLAEPGGEEIHLDSTDAETFEHRTSSSAEGSELELVYGRHRGLDLRITCRASLPAGTALTRWRIAVANGTRGGVRSLQYPVIVVPTPLDGAVEEEYYLDPSGRIYLNPRPEEYPERGPTDWIPHAQYPGPRPVQLLAYYTGAAGMYLATYDSAGCIKDLGAHRLGEDLDLSVDHHFDERPGLDFELPYETVLGVFHGDWYDAADIYKEWAYRQPWCARKLADRDDIPGWLTEPRPQLMTISQGGQERIHGLQTTPGEYPIGRFFPARRAVALQQEYARRFGTPIVSWMEGWEKIGAPGGPVEIFPPREGEESYRAAMAELRRDGHIPVMYLAGFHWCYRRPQVGYDDWPRFEREGRCMAALDRHGELMISNQYAHMYAMGQKHYAVLCVGSPDLWDLYLKNFDRMMDVGAVGVQLDQQGGMNSQVCYSPDHDHPPGYGPWMTEKTGDFVRAVRSAAKARDPEAAYSVEGPCEYWIPEMDFFLDRPYHYEPRSLIHPLFEYIYHEYATVYSGDGIVNVLHPAASLMLHAKVFTLGLRNTVAYGEEEYNFEVNPDYPVLALLRNICQAQRGFARDYVVFGQMQRPTALEVDHVRADGFRGEPWEVMIPKVYHGVWRAPDGKVGTVLANWTEEAQEVTVGLSEVDGPVATVAATQRVAASPQEVRDRRLSVQVPALGILLVEQGS